jgi:hypothetical protein
VPDVPAATAAVMPSHTHTPRGRGAARLMLAVALGAGLLLSSLSVADPQAALAGSSCTGWKSLTVAPDTIRVRVGTDKVRTVNFKNYVAIVMGNEWGGYLPQATLDAAAIAVKQYAWYFALAGHHRGYYVTPSGECYDVAQTTADQIFDPVTANVVSKHWRAIKRTWSTTLRKNGRFIMTSYRTGASGVRCGADADGWHLKARSAIDCARRGLSGAQILRQYYGSGLSFVSHSAKKAAPAPVSPPVRAAASVASDTAADAALLVSWEVGRSNTKIARYRVQQRLDGGAWTTLGTIDGGALSLAAALPHGDESATVNARYRVQSIAADGRRSDWVRTDLITLMSLDAAVDGGLSPLQRWALQRAEAADAAWGRDSSAVSFQAIGRGVAIIGSRAPEAGRMDVYVDGELVASVDLYAAEPIAGVVLWSADWDEAAERSIRLEPEGNASDILDEGSVLLFN